MLSLQNILAMSSPLRLATLATISTLLFASPSIQQTSTTCNPTEGSCPADTALGKSVSVSFTSGASSDFTASGNPTYGSNGAVFTISESGDAPTLESNWYIMFGTYTIKMKAAPGQGIVSSVVLQSDDLDEIDWEWVGSQDNQAQSNYFGKGQTTTYDRGAAHAVSDPTGTWHTYSIIWTDEQIVWQIDGSTVRVLGVGDANGQYPQTPMKLKIGAWSGGDPSNAAGTIAWAGGDTDYSAGPYSMYVESVSVTDYSTGTSYTYGNESGDWQSIEAAGGSVNGNAPADGTTAAAPAITSTTSGNPESGSGTCVWAARCSDGVSTAPTSEETLVSSSAAAAATTSNSPASPSSSAASPASAFCSASGYSVVTSYDEQGFLTTMTIPAGVSTGWDIDGKPTTAYPSNCLVSNLAIAAGDVLKVTSTSNYNNGGSEDAGGGTTTSGQRGVLGTSSEASLVAPTGTAKAGGGASSDAEIFVQGRWIAVVGALGIAMGLGLLMG